MSFLTRRLHRPRFLFQVRSFEKSSTLWACSFSDAPQGVTPPPSTLHAFDLATGTPKGKWLCRRPELVRHHVVVNVLETNRLFSVPIQIDGKAGPVAEVKLDRPPKNPDGQRTYGDDGILIVDAGEGGRLMHVTLKGDKLDAGTVKTLQSGFANGPASVTVVGHAAYVIEAKFETADKPPVKPFKAIAVNLVQ